MCGAELSRFVALQIAAEPQHDRLRSACLSLPFPKSRCRPSGHQKRRWELFNRLPEIANQDRIRTRAFRHLLDRSLDVLPAL
jgi:hypothetical protein